MSENSQKIVIVGAGLVGCLAAIYLAKCGFLVEIYEYRKDTRESKILNFGKSINLALSNRGLNALRNAGIDSTLLNQVLIPMKGRMIHDEYGKCQPLLYDVKYEQCIYSIGRNKLNNILLTEAEKSSKIYFQHKVLKIKFADKTLKILKININEKVVEKFDYLIGCDGAYSIVRQYMIKTPLFNFSQNYIDHGYLELYIPPLKNSNKNKLCSSYLHIWPRVTFMMIALPNQDNSWTVTLFMPFQLFNSIANTDKLLKFFNKYFPDALILMGKQNLIKSFFSSKPEQLISIKCNPYYVKDCLIIGDAAHAVVPFYGQGMNAGFEDCYFLYKYFQNNKNIAETFEQFSKNRIPEGHAISDLSMYNYLEMRNLVLHKQFLYQKKFDNFLYKYLPGVWKPLYICVTFTDIPYSECLKIQNRQNKIVKIILVSLGFFLVWITHMLLKYKQ